jgi:hypothetical protein
VPSSGKNQTQEKISVQQYYTTSPEMAVRAVPTKSQVTHIEYEL